MIQMKKKPVEPTSSQCYKILWWLSSKGQITPIDALESCGCFRLSERIRELEALGWDIRHEWVKLPSGKRVMGYKLK
jgi:hypothetical protein